MSYACAATIGYLTPLLMSSIHFYTFMFFAVFNILAFIYGSVVPETSGINLEVIHLEFEKFFGEVYTEAPRASESPDVQSP